MKFMFSYAVNVKLSMDERERERERQYTYVCKMVFKELANPIATQQCINYYFEN